MLVKQKIFPYNFKILILLQFIEKKILGYKQNLHKVLTITDKMSIIKLLKTINYMLKTKNLWKTIYKKCDLYNIYIHFIVSLNKFHFTKI